MKKYFKINEIASLYGISPDTLRYYERLGLAEPRRDTNGYRMYGLNDLWRLNVIRDLRALGVSMEKITAYLQNRSTLTTKQLLQEEVNLLDVEIRNLRKLKKQAETKLQTICEATGHETDAVRQIHLEERRYSFTTEGYQQDEEMDMLIRRLLLEDKDASIIGNNRIGSFLSTQKNAGGTYSYTGVFMINEHGPGVFPAGNYLTMTHQGDIHDINTLAGALLDYAAHGGLQHDNRILELLWVDIHSAADRREYLTEFQLRVF